MNWAEYSGSEEEEIKEVPKEHSLENDREEGSKRPPNNKPYGGGGGKRKNGNRERKPKMMGQSCLVTR